MLKVEPKILLQLSENQRRSDVCLQIRSFTRIVAYALAWAAISVAAASCGAECQDGQPAECAESQGYNPCRDHTCSGWMKYCSGGQWQNIQCEHQQVDSGAYLRRDAGSVDQSPADTSIASSIDEKSDAPDFDGEPGRLD
jgi:hypothetical protein